MTSWPWPACLLPSPRRSPWAGLYSSTRAARNHDRQVHAGAIDADGHLSPGLSGFTTFSAALVAGLVPLAPFAFFALPAAVVISVAISVVALFALGSWMGTISGAIWWRDGLRRLAVAVVVACAAAAVGTIFRVA